MTTYKRIKKHEAEKRAGRFTTMSIPGREEDGSDTSWYVVDRGTFKPIKLFGTYDQAATECRRRNGMSKAEYLNRVN